MKLIVPNSKMRTTARIKLKSIKQINKPENVRKKQISVQNLSKQKKHF